MAMPLRTISFPVLAITPSMILLIAVALCLLAFLAILLMKKRPPRPLDNSAEGSERTDYAAIARDLLAAVGGKENVSSVDYCATRLRFEIKDFTAINEKAVKAAGAAGVIRPSKNTCQVIIGPKAQFVYDELKKML